MALSIGTLVGYLSLDDTNFNRKADQADRKIQALKLHLDALKASNPKIAVEVDAQTAKLDELKAKIDDLKVKAAEGVDVKVEMTQAMIDLDRVQAKLRDLHNKEIKVKVDVDDQPAVKKIESLDTRLSALQQKIKGKGGPGWLMTGILGAGPAVVPLLGAATGGLLAMGTAAVGAAGGIGVLKLAYHGLSSEVQAYAKYQQQLGAATNAKQRAAALKTLSASAYGTGTSQSQDLTRFLVNQGAPAFHQLQNTAQAAVFPGTTRALKDLITLLPVADRLVGRLGSTMGTMEAEAAHALTNPFWKHFFDQIGITAKNDLPLLGRAFGNVFEGIARMMERFAPSGTSSLAYYIEHLSREFNHWTASKRFEGFLKAVREDGGAVASVLRPLGPILKNLGSSLNGEGIVELRGLGWGLAQIAKIPPGPFKLLAESIGPFFLALKGIGLARSGAAGLVGIAGVLSKIKGLGGLSKLGGRLGGTVAGEVGGVALGKGVVPVYVTNKGFGGGSGLPGEPGVPGEGPGIPAATKLPLLATLGTVGATAGLVGGGFAAEVALINHLQRFKPSTLNVPYAPIMAAPSGGAQKEMSPTAIAAAQMNIHPDDLKRYNEQLTKLIALDRKLYPAANSAQAGVDALGKGFRQLIKVNPSGAMASLQKISDVTGISIKHLVQLVPGLGAAMKNAGIPTTKLGVALAALPKNVQTAISVPGALSSMADVRKLARQYDLTPKEIRTLIQLLGANQAISAAQALQQKIAALHSKDITIRVNEIHATSFGPHAKAIAGNADGGTVPKTGLPYADRHLYMLADGEEVISNRHGQADRWRPFLKAINAGHLANGGTAGHHHRGHQHAQTAAERLKAKENRRRDELNRRLASIEKVLGRTNTLIGNAHAFGSAFAGNVFAAGLPTTKQVNVPGHTFTKVINGQLVTESTPGTTKTVKLSNSQLLASMVKYQKGQRAQALRLAHDVRKLSREGVSKSLLAQMQAGGAQGIAEIHALAQGSRSQVHQFNRLNAQTNAALNQAGAYAASGHPMAHLQRQRQNEEATVRAIKKALHNLTVTVKHSKLRVN